MPGRARGRRFRSSCRATAWTISSFDRRGRRAARPARFTDPRPGGGMPLRMRIHERELIGAALRRFKKLLERSGMQKELRKRRHYEKPCEVRRRAKLRKLAAAAKAKRLASEK